MLGMLGTRTLQVRVCGISAPVGVLLSLALCLGTSCIAQDHSFRKKIGIGWSIGYRGEYPGGGILMEWQPFRRLMADAGFAWGNINSEQVYGLKYMMDTLRVTGKIRPCWFVGCNYAVRYAGGTGIGKDPPFTIYDMPTSIYVVPTIGLWGGTLRVDTSLVNGNRRPIPHSIFCGGRIYLSLNYRIRLAGGDAKYQRGPLIQGGERLVNNIAKGGLGICAIAIIDLHVPPARHRP